MTPLHAVPDEPQPADPHPGMIPNFEGKDVATTRVVIGSTATLDFDQVVVRHDDLVRVIVEARVVGIGHQVNPVTGQLERIQRLKPVEAALTPWDPADPTDGGVFR